MHIVYMKSIEWTKKRKPLGITWVMRIYAMNGDNELFVTAIRNFAKSANVSGNRFLGKISSLIKKSEEPFVGRKGHRACIKTLSFEPVPVFHDADGLLRLTFCFSS